MGDIVSSEEAWFRRAFAALSMKTRKDVIRLLSHSAPSGLEAGAIAKSLHISPSNASFHLKELEYAGLIIGQRSGRSVIYTISNQALRDIVKFLSELRDGGDGPSGPVNDIVSVGKVACREGS